MREWRPACGTGRRGTRTGRDPRTRRFASLLRRCPRRQTRRHTAVSSYAADDGERLLLFDPLVVPREIEELAAACEPVVVLTCPWHERDTQSLAERLGAPVFTPTPDEGSPDVAWLLGVDGSDAHLYSAGDRLPVGVEALPGRLPNDLVLWIESRLLYLPVEVVLATHGGPTDQAALERSLAWQPSVFTCRTHSFARREQTF